MVKYLKHNNGLAKTMINHKGEDVNFLSLIRDMFSGNLKDVFIILTILLAYAVGFGFYFFGIIEAQPSLNSLVSMLIGQLLLVSFALWLKKNYPDTK